MKLKFLKQGVCALVLASVFCVLPVQSALAAPITYNMEYTDTPYGADDEQALELNSFTKGVTMTVDGELKDNPSLINFTGTGCGNMTVRFDNLYDADKLFKEDKIEGYANWPYLTLWARLDNGYTLHFLAGGWSLGATFYVNADDSPYSDEALIYAEDWLDEGVIPFEGAYFDKVKSGVTYDIGKTIDFWMARITATHPEIIQLLQQHNIVSKSMFIGIKYRVDYDAWGVRYIAEDIQNTPIDNTINVEEKIEEKQNIQDTQEILTNQNVQNIQQDIEGGDLIYIVKAGDTLGSISANFYGNNSKGGEIRKQNDAVFAANKGKLVEGMQLVLPAKLGSKTRIAEPIVNAGETLYTVMDGDTLCGIAKSIYGTEAKIADIFARNSDRLSDASKLFPGQIIVLPEK